MGALGPVFRTYEPTRDRLVAVKVFRLDITPEQSQVLADELAHAAEAELFHPSIVEPIAAGVEGTVAYRAEEYVAAESLDVAMRHYAPASFDTMMRIIGQLSEAIDVARGAGVGHGALHPRDIFVTPDDARASGFGVVDALERVGLRAPVRRPYSAPERIAGAQWSTPADVFSLGAIAFELLTGRRPSGTGEEMGPLTGAVAAHADRLQAILARAMHESPGERFASGLAFADALASAGAPHAQAFDSAVAYPDESGSPAIQMIPIPSEAPEFADEEVGDALDAAVGDGDRAAAGPPVILETADVAAERDDDVALRGLTGEEAAAARASDAYDAEPAVSEHDAEGSSAPRADETATDDVEAEAAADALVFDAAALALSEESPASEFRDEFRASAHARESHLQIEPDGTSAQAEEARDPAFAASLFNRPGSPPQIVERDLRPGPAHDAHDRVPFEHLLASVDRPRSTMLDRAMTLLVGLLIGFGAGYIAAWRGQPFQTVASNNVSTTQPGASEPQGTPAVTPGTAADARERPAPPPSVPGPPRERAPAAPPASARSGKLVVRSTPPGAAVTINGKWSGRTPLTRETLAFGDYTVRVLLPGYQTRNEQVSLSADSALRTLSVQLQQEAASSRATGAPAAGRPQAASPGPAASAARPGPAASAARPAAGASATTPVPGGSAARPGPAASATRPGAGASATTPVPGGSAAPPTPAGSAARPGPASAAPTGALEIDSRPMGARVFVDDQSVGTTPVRVPDVTPGSHVVRLELADHRTWTEVAQVARGRTARVAGSLEPIR